MTNLNTKPHYTSWMLRISTSKKGRTVTRKFVCLGDNGQMEIPSVQEKRELFLFGLDEKKIAMPVISSPKLSDAGGFELLYAEQGKRELNLNTVEYISQARKSLYLAVSM